MLCQDSDRFSGDPRRNQRAGPAPPPAREQWSPVVAVESLPMPTQPDPESPVFALHRGGKIEVISKVPVRDRDDLSLAYTPGVAEVCLAIADHPELVHDYTWKSSTVAVVTDGTAVLGLGDIGPAASLPALEGK